MKTIEEFRKLYDNQLVHTLTPLEEKRKKFVNSFIVSLAAWIAAVLASVLFSPVMPYLLGIILLISGFYITRKQYRVFKRSLTDEFKHTIISRITTITDEDLVYEPNSGISQETFEYSGIVNSRVDWYHSEDYFEGTIDNTHICFSEVQAKEKSTDPETGQSSYYPIFQGLLFAADFNKRFNSRTVVITDFLKNMPRLGSLISKTIAAPASSEVVQLESPEFSKHFSVFSDDQVEARFILSSSMMERILDFRKKHPHFSISFVDSQIYIGIILNKNLFEPRIFKQIATQELLESYLHYILLVLGIVEDLNMNERNWPVSNDN